jgi:hypothetical protein
MSPAAARRPPPCCEIRRKLGDAFATSARVYAESVVALTRSSGITKSEYEQLSIAAREAQERSQRTRGV